MYPNGHHLLINLKGENLSLFYMEGKTCSKKRDRNFMQTGPSLAGMLYEKRIEKNFPFLLSEKKSSRILSKNTL